LSIMVCPSPVVVQICLGDMFDPFPLLSRLLRVERHDDEDGPVVTDQDEVP